VASRGRREGRVEAIQVAGVTNKPRLVCNESVTLPSSLRPSKKLLLLSPSRLSLMLEEGRAGVKCEVEHNLIKD